MQLYGLRYDLPVAQIPNPFRRIVEQAAQNFGGKTRRLRFRLLLFESRIEMIEIEDQRRRLGRRSCGRRCGAKPAHVTEAGRTDLRLLQRCSGLGLSGASTARSKKTMHWFEMPLAG